MEDKIYDLLAKLHKDMNERFDRNDKRFDKLEQDVGGLKQDVGGLKKDVAQIGAKLDGEISDKLKIMADEQSLMRKDILDIKEQLHIHDTKLDDITIAVNDLHHKYEKHEDQITELKRVR